MFIPIPSKAMKKLIVRNLYRNQAVLFMRESFFIEDNMIFESRYDLKYLVSFMD